MLTNIWIMKMVSQSQADLIRWMISSVLTLRNNSLCSSLDSLSSFLSSVIKPSFSWRNLSIQTKVPKIEKNRSNYFCFDEYPRNSIWLGLKCPKNRTVCFLLKLMYYALHIILHPRAWRCSSSSFSTTSNRPSAIVKKRWKIIISSCSEDK